MFVSIDISDQSDALIDLISHGWCRWSDNPQLPEQIQYLCFVFHSSNNSRPSTCHMDMVFLCHSLRTPRACSLQPSLLLAAVLVSWHSPVPWGGSPTSQLKMRRSTMTMITKEVCPAKGLCGLISLLFFFKFSCLKQARGREGGGVFRKVPS